MASTSFGIRPRLNRRLRLLLVGTAQVSLHVCGRTLLNPPHLICSSSRLDGLAGHPVARPGKSTFRLSDALMALGPTRSTAFQQAMICSMASGSVSASTIGVPFSPTMTYGASSSGSSQIASTIFRICSSSSGPSLGGWPPAARLHRARHPLGVQPVAQMPPYRAAYGRRPTSAPHTPSREASFLVPRSAESDFSGSAHSLGRLSACLAHRPSRPTTCTATSPHPSPLGKVAWQ
jgi:hypothetical protein